VKQRQSLIVQVSDWLTTPTYSGLSGAVRFERCRFRWNCL